MARKKTVVQNKEMYQCASCGRTSPNKNLFYLDSSKIYENDRVPLCKDCIHDYLSLNDEKRLIEILRIVNKPFIFNEVRKFKTHSEYLKEMSSIGNRKYTFLDSVFEYDEEVSSMLDNSRFSEEILARWSEYSSAKEIEFLEDYYQELTSRYRCETPIQKSMYRQMAETQLMINRARQNGDTKVYKDMIDVLRNLQGDANIKPIQDLGDDDGSLNNWGNWVKKIEEEEPIPEAEGDFKDPDRIWEYVQKWFVNHFSKVFGIENKETDKLKDD